MRALVARSGTITEAWHYDSWGSILSMPALTWRNTVLDERLQDLIRQGKIIHKPIL